MTERYDEAAAAHYAAYRPPLHPMILSRALASGESFSLGLDVGCGTGYSTHALAGHCEQVFGIDPSPSMLERAVPRRGVTYLQGAAERIPLPNRSIEIVTFAGSLFYADIETTAEEIRRVTGEKAIVVVYDFEILLGDVLQRVGIEAGAEEGAYNHRVNFSGTFGFEELVLGAERIAVRVTASELAHVVLSDSHRLDRFADRYEAADPFAELVGDLESVGDHHELAADVYYSKYRVFTAQQRFGDSPLPG